MSEKTPQGNPSTPAPAVEVRIEKILNQGDGLGRHDGQAVFVPLSAPGDLVRATIIKQGRGFVQTTLEEVIEAGPNRQEAPCSHFGDCGGCNLQQINPEGQRQVKADIVLDCFQRLGKMDVSSLLTGPEPVGKDLGYRNRIRVFANPAGHYGMMRRGSHDVVALQACPLLPAQFNEDILPWLRMMPPVEQIIVRLDGNGGWLLSLFGPPQRMRVLKKILAAMPVDEGPAPGCRGMMFNNRPIWGKDFLIYEVAGHKFRVSAQSFFQGNLAVTEKAVEQIGLWLKEIADRGELGTLLGDLYCGVGLFTLTLGNLFEKIVAVDNDPYSIRDAQNNVRRDSTVSKIATVIKGDLAETLGDAKVASDELWSESCCLVDPPRTGLGKDGVQTILGKNPRHLVYMSCDPATMARDASALVEAGYLIQKLQVLDMFPQTSHIETLMLLEKQK